MSTADLLAQGIAAARAGRKDEAQATLLKVLETDDRSELAWLWLSGVMGSPDERRICLENVLEINPANTHARRGIELLAQSHPPAPRADCPRPAPGPPEPAPQPTPAPQPATTLRLPDANGNPPPAAATSVTAPAGPVTGDTVELPPEALQTPAKQPWWRRQKPKAAQPPPAAPPSTAPAPIAAAAPPAGSIALPAVATEAGNAEEPCPYCGATTLVAHRSCPACRKSLMVRTQPREKRSVALIILVIIYALNSAGALAGGVMTIISLVSFAMMITDAGMDFPIVPLIVSIVAVLVIVGISITMTLSLYRRKRGAYIFHCVNVGFAILSAIALIALSTLAGAAFTSFLNELDPESTRDAAGAVSAIASSLGLVILCDGSVLLGLLALTVLSYDDFFGRMVRMSTAGLTSEGDTYNAGISYRNRGMWYMAAHEWELAAKSAPRDVTVWRALGLAYAQLKRYDQARDALSVALAMAPSDPQLTEDLVLVERLTAKR